MASPKEPYWPKFHADVRYRVMNGIQSRHLRLTSTVRLKKNDVWYDVLIREHYEIETEPLNQSDIELFRRITLFNNKCLLTKFFYDPIGATILNNEGNRVELKPSPLQISEEDRLKKQFIDYPLLKSKQ